MKGTETESRTAMPSLSRPPRRAAFAVAAAIAGGRPAASGGANAAVPAARRGYETVAAIAGEKNRLRSNNTIQRRPRSKSFINIGIPLAAPLMVGVRPLEINRDW